MKKALQLFAILICAVISADFMHTKEMLNTVEHQVIRLHILANSDSTADQTLKLLVRDTLISNADTWIPENASWEKGCESLREHLPEIRTLAEKTLREAGCPDAVTVSFGNDTFPERKYGSITLPAGDYQALRVEIGSGEGQNWWCVMFPSLCTTAAQSENAELLPEGARDIVEAPEKYEVRLKCIDFFRSVIRWLRG